MLTKLGSVSFVFFWLEFWYGYVTMVVVMVMVVVIDSWWVWWLLCFFNFFWAMGFDMWVKREKTETLL